MKFSQNGEKTDFQFTGPITVQKTESLLRFIDLQAACIIARRRSVLTTDKVESKFCQRTILFRKDPEVSVHRFFEQGVLKMDP